MDSLPRDAEGMEEQVASAVKLVAYWETSAELLN